MKASKAKKIATQINDLQIRAKATVYHNKMEGRHLVLVTDVVIGKSLIADLEKIIGNIYYYFSPSLSESDKVEMCIG